MLTQRERCRNSGFSLLEIVVVVSILAIIMAIGMMNAHRAQANRQLDATAMELVNAMKYARQMAISSNGVTVAFNSGASPPTYSVTTSGGTLLKKFTIPVGATLSVENAISPLTFAANGSANAAGNITVTSAQTGRVGTIAIKQTAGTASVTLP